MKMLINGQWVEAMAGACIDVINPATHVVVDKVPEGRKEDADLAVSHALEGFRINRSLPASKRYDYLVRLGELIMNHRNDLRNTMISENGKSWSWADYEVRKSAEIFINLANRVKDPQGVTYPMDSLEGTAGQLSMVYRQARGVVGGIIPFNFPLEMLAYKVGGALAAGNSIVVKLPEESPLCCLKAGKLILKAGIPKEAVHLITGFGETAGQALVDHPDVPMINFTGSTEVGRTIMQRAAKHLKHLSLELGGNDPVIVFEDADLDLVAQNLAKGRMTVGNGQACVADKRFIVHESIYEALIAKCVKAIDGLKIGNPANRDVDVGPLISESAVQKIIHQIDASVQKGAKIVAGGQVFNKTFLQPTIIRDVTSAMSLFREEVFGPVAPFTIFKDEEEAIALANDSVYGLQGAVYCNDVSRALRVADEMDVGGVMINGSSCFRPGNVPYMPRKQSGLGTDNMYNAYNENTHGKAIIINQVINRFFQYK